MKIKEIWHCACLWFSDLDTPAPVGLHSKRQQTAGPEDSSPPSPEEGSFRGPSARLDRGPYQTLHYLFPGKNMPKVEFNLWTGHSNRFQQ